MPTTHHAAEVLRRLHAADPGAIKHLLQANAVLNQEAASIPGTSVVFGTSPPILTGLGLINTILKAMTGDTLVTDGFYGHPSRIEFREPVRRLVDDFDPAQVWEDHWDALDYISRQPDTDLALRLIVDANIAADERGWAAELLRQAPDFWEKPDQSALQVAAKFFGDMRCSWEHPGYLSIQHKGIDFAFGDDNPSDDPADGAEALFVMFDYALPDDPGHRIDGGGKCSATLSCARIADFIRKAIVDTCAKHPEAAAYKKPGTQYRAVPVLMYVPLTDNEDADVQRALDNARGEPEIRALYAEDFDAGVATEDEDNDLSAMIQTACPRAKGC